MPLIAVVGLAACNSAVFQLAEDISTAQDYRTLQKTAVEQISAYNDAIGSPSVPSTDASCILYFALEFLLCQTEPSPTQHICKAF